MPEEREEAPTRSPRAHGPARRRAQEGARRQRRRTSGETVAHARECRVHAGDRVGHPRAGTHPAEQTWRMSAAPPPAAGLAEAPGEAGAAGLAEAFGLAVASAGAFSDAVTAVFTRDRITV